MRIAVSSVTRAIIGAAIGISGAMLLNGPSVEQRDYVLFNFAPEATLRRQSFFVDWRQIDVKLTSMKTLPKMEISEDLDKQISQGMEVSELCKADVIRHALRIGLPQFASRFQPAPLWLEERIREALAEPGEFTSKKQFDAMMQDIADGR